MGAAVQALAAASLLSAADAAIRVMGAAARANVTDDFRHGTLIELPAAGDVMVTGDLHGNTANLRRIVELADLSRHPARHLILQELVHEVEADNATCRSWRLVEAGARLKAAFPQRVHILLGNHEFSELLRLEIGKRGRELNAAFRDGVQAQYGARAADVTAAYHRFWRTCPLAAHTDNGVFIAHSTPRMEKSEGFSLDFFRHLRPEAVFERNGPVFALLWGRDYRPRAAEDFARKVEAETLLVGHTACREGIYVPNARHIILDCKDMEGRYALLPLAGALTQKDALKRVLRLYPEMASLRPASEDLDKGSFD